MLYVCVCVCFRLGERGKGEQKKEIFQSAPGNVKVPLHDQLCITCCLRNTPYSCSCNYSMVKLIDIVYLRTYYTRGLSVHLFPVALFSDIFCNELTKLFHCAQRTVACDSYVNGLELDIFSACPCVTAEARHYPIMK
jgi:hypothetical protein